jgi:hypothetical protein
MFAARGSRGNTGKCTFRLRRVTLACLARTVFMQPSLVREASRQHWLFAPPDL